MYVSMACTFVWMYVCMYVNMYVCTMYYVAGVFLTYDIQVFNVCMYVCMYALYVYFNKWRSDSIYVCKYVCLYYVLCSWCISDLRYYWFRSPLLCQVGSAGPNDGLPGQLYWVRYSHTGRYVTYHKVQKKLKYGNLRNNSSSVRKSGYHTLSVACMAAPALRSRWITSSLPDLAALISRVSSSSSSSWWEQNEK